MLSQSGTKTSRSRSAKRAGSESSQECLSLPPPSPMTDPLLTPTLDPLMSFQGLSSPSDSTMLMTGSQDPMLSMPSPGQGSDPMGLLQAGLPTVLGSPVGPLLVSYRVTGSFAKTVLKLKYQTGRQHNTLSPKVPPG